MKIKTSHLFGVLFAAVLAYAGYVAWRAHRNLVTLHLHNVPFKKAVAAVRWQTWEKIEAHKDIKGNISIDVDRMPLEEVLDILGEQVSARWSAVYPLYYKKASLASLDKAIKGEIEAKNSAFTNYASRGFGGRGFGGPGGAGGPGGFGFLGGGAETNAGPKLVSMNLTNKDLSIALMALGRFNPGRVVPENGLSKKLTMKIAEEPFDAAVEKIARQAGAKWTKLYAFSEAGGPFMARLGAGGPREGGWRGEGRPEFSEERREAMRKEMAEVMSVLPPEMQEKAQEQREIGQEIRNLPQEARQQIMSERMNSPEAQTRIEQRMMSGVKNSTPEQRRNRYERMYQMRKNGGPAGQGRGRPNR